MGVWVHNASSIADIPSFDGGEIPLGPKSPQSALGGDLTYPDPTPTFYRGNFSPDTPVQDHNLARALGGDPEDAANIDLRAWAENARKGALEGQYNASKAELMAGGLTEEQARWVLELELNYIKNDIRAKIVDINTLKALPSP